MKRILYLVLALTSTLSIGLSAKTFCFSSKLSATGGAEFLYWRAGEQGIEYGYYETVVAAPSFTTNELLDLQPSYGPGFRVFGRIGDKCLNRFAEIEWIYFRHTTTATAKEDPSRGVLKILSSTSAFNNAPVSLVRIKQQDRYNNVTLRLAQCIAQDCWGCMYVYIGGGWREISVRDQFTYRPTADATNPPTSQDMAVKLSAGAMLMGLDLSANLGCGFGANLRSGLVVIIGHLSTSYLSTGLIKVIDLEPGRFSSREKPQVNCLIGYEAVGSVYYARPIRCVCVRAEVGYRIDYYFSLTTKAEFQGYNEPTEQVNRAYGGPFAGISICY